MLAALCTRAQQLLHQLEPEQIARLTWALGRQQQLAAAAQRTATQQAPGGSSSSSSSSIVRAGGQQQQQQRAGGDGNGSNIACIAQLLPGLLSCIEECLPLMNPHSLATTAEGLQVLIVGQATVREQMSEESVLVWLRVVQRSLERGGRRSSSAGSRGAAWQVWQVEKVLSFFGEVPVLQQRHQHQFSDRAGRQPERAEVNELTASMLGAAKRAGFDIKQLWKEVGEVE